MLLMVIKLKKDKVGVFRPHHPNNGFYVMNNEFYTLPGGLPLSLPAA